MIAPIYSVKYLNNITYYDQGMVLIQISSLVCWPILISWSDSATTLLDFGWYFGCWVRGLIANALRKVDTLPNFRFCGCSQAGRSSLSTRGGSLNQICRFVHSFHVSRGSTTGSRYTFLYFLKKSATFSTAIIFSKFSKNMGQFTYRQLYCLANYSYSSAVLNFPLDLSQIKEAISQYPGKTANSRVDRPYGVINLQSAPCSNKQRTILIWFLLTAATRGVYPLSVGWLTAAPHYQTRKTVVQKSPLYAVLKRGVILVFYVNLWFSRSGLFSKTFFMLLCYFLSMQQSRYSRSEYVIAMLFAAPIQFNQFIKDYKMKIKLKARLVKDYNRLIKTGLQPG